MFSAPCDATFKPESGVRRAGDQKTGQKNHHDIENVRNCIEEKTSVSQHVYVALVKG